MVLVMAFVRLTEFWLRMSLTNLVLICVASCMVVSLSFRSLKCDSKEFGEAF